MRRDDNYSQGGEPLAASASLKPCRKCNRQTPWPTLSALGAQCRGCYEAWCSEAPSWPDPVPDGAAPGENTSRAWAWQLRWREQQGQALSRPQREGWRTALPGVELHSGAPA